MSTVDVAQLRAQLEELLPTVGAATALRRLGPAPTDTGGRANIVILGEPSTGKTSLVNAIVGDPGLLPVVPSTSYIAVGGLPDVTVRAYYPDGRSVSGDLALIRGALAADADDRPERIEAGIPHPRLTGLTLFDTPGVGAMDCAATELALRAVELATAVVFVVSAAAKISLAERTFLAEAAARVDQVVFVLTKIDAHPEWEAVLDENIETIRGDFRRFPPGRFDDIAFIPFSARLAALSDDDPELAADSGVDTLWEKLDEIAERQARLSEVNALRAIVSTIDDAEAILAERQRTLENPLDEREFVELSLKITQLTASSAVWRNNLSREISAARDAVSTLQRRRITRLRTEYDAELNGKVKPKSIGEIEARIVADLCAMQEEAGRDVRQHLTEIARRLLAEIPGGEEAAEALTGDVPEPAETPSDYLRQRPPAPRDPTELTLGVQAMFIGSSMARTLVASLVGAVGLAGGAAGTVAIAASLPVGLVWWRVQRAMRRRAMDVAGLRAWVVESIHAANTEIAADIDRGFRRGFDALHEGVAASLTDALEAATAARNDLDRARDQAAADLQRVTHLKDQLGPIRAALTEHRAALLTADSGVHG